MSCTLGLGSLPGCAVAAQWMNAAAAPPFPDLLPPCFPADVYAFNGVEHARYHHAVLHILVSAAHPPPQMPAVDRSAYHAQLTVLHPFCQMMCVVSMASSNPRSFLLPACRAIAPPGGPRSSSASTSCLSVSPTREWGNHQAGIGPALVALLLALWHASRLLLPALRCVAHARAKHTTKKGF